MHFIEVSGECYYCMMADGEMVKKGHLKDMVCFQLFHIMHNFVQSLCICSGAVKVDDHNLRELVSTHALLYHSVCWLVR